MSTYVMFKGTDGKTDPTPLLAADGDHPSARGHQRIAQALRACCRTADDRPTEG